MKATIILLLVVLSLALVLGHWPNRFKGCRSNKDCGKRRCCIKYYGFSFCAMKLREGHLCGFHDMGMGKGRFACGCRDELVCKKTGYFLKQCVKDEGSGDDDFLY